MKSIDGIITAPKGLTRDVRRLVVVALIVVPVGVLGSVAVLGMQGKPISDVTSSPAASPAHATTPSVALPTPPPVADHTPPQPSSGQSASSVELHTQSTPGSAPVTKLNVNQQSIDVPASGSVHKVITNGNSTTTVDVSNSSSSDVSSSSTNIQLNASSTTTSGSDTSTGP